MEMVLQFLKSLPMATLSNDGRQLIARCPFCGDNPENPRATHFNIRIDTLNNEALLYQCFRPACQEPTGRLTTEALQRMGCHDMRAILELTKYNANIKGFGKDKLARVKLQRKLAVSNPLNNRNLSKVLYLEKRLGHKFDNSMLKQFRIQLSLNDFIKINSIKKLAFDSKFCEMIDKFAIGFVSTYKDYIIFRDISKPQFKIFKSRYMNYRIMGEVDDNDKKFYTIPFEMDILDPEPVVINMAEGIISIMGVYLNTDIDRDRNSQIFGAPCGTGYFYLLYHLCKQYGLTLIDINIFSDSEIKKNKYDKLIKDIMVAKFCKINSFTVYYNDLKEDFGHCKENIQISKYKLI